MDGGWPGSPVPVTVISGFLGAGKTTLLNHVLTGNHGVRTGVLVNDFGALHIDSKRVAGVEGETIRLANGCVCCTIRDDLVSGCLELLDQPEPPEHLLIELSGVSSPIPVLETFLQPGLASFFSLASTLAVVDAEQMPALGGELRELARTQIVAADVVALNKADLVGPDELAEVERRLRELAPGSRIFETCHGRVPAGLIFETAFDPRGSRAGADSRGHCARSHLDSFSAWHWTAQGPLSLPKLRAALDALPDAVYRAKGIVCLEELPRYRVVLQVVGRRHHLRDDGPWGLEGGVERRRSEIVVIGARDGFDPEALQRTFDACFATGDASQSPVLRLSRRLGLAGVAEPGSEERQSRGPAGPRVMEGP